MAPKKKAEPKKAETTSNNNTTTTKASNSAAVVVTKQSTPPQQSEKASSKSNIVEKSKTVDESKNVKQQQTSSTSKNTNNQSNNQNATSSKPVTVANATPVNSTTPVVTNNNELSTASKKKKKQKSSDTTTTSPTVATTTPVVTSTNANTTPVQSTKNNNNTVTITPPTTSSSSSSNENSKKKKKKSSSSESTNSTNTQSVTETVKVVNPVSTNKNSTSPNSVTTSPTTVANDIATTAQPTPIVKAKSAHDPGKDDNSLSAWLCRAYFAIGLFIAWNLCFIVVLPMYICHILFGFDKNKSLMGWLFRYFNRCVVETNPFWNIKTFYANGSTKNRLPKKQKKVIFICNHQSGMDPFILISALPIEAKWVAKHIIFKIPIAGWLMSMIGDVPIVFTSKKAESTTTDKSSVTRALDTLRNYLNNDCAVFFFPEGRRSDNPDEFLEFRKGAFVMALQTGADIIPIAISGSHTIWELKHKLPRPGRCAMVVGDPISVKGMTLENDVDNLLQKSRKAVEDLYQIAKKKAKSLK